MESTRFGLLLLLLLLLTGGGLVSLAPPPPPTDALAISSPCPRAARTSTNYQYRGELHFVCLQLRPNSPARLDVVQFRGAQLVWSSPIDEPNTSQLASFVDNEGTLRILLAVPNKINGTTMYSVDRAGRGLDERHTVNTQFVSSMAVWRLELNWEWHLAIANEPYLDAESRPPQSGQPGPILALHAWRHTYFDRYQTIELAHNSRVNKLEPVHINGQQFLLVAMEPSGAAQIDLATGRPALAPSLIYKLDFSTGALAWTHYQTLNTHVALDASSFSITHRNSLQVDYYVGLIGRLQPADGASSMLAHEPEQRQHGLTIYKYLGDRFVESSSIPAPGATKLDTISYGHGDSYVVVAVQSGWPRPQISLFLFDGLALKPLPSPERGLGATARPAPMTPSRHRRLLETDNMHFISVAPPPPPAPEDGNNTLDKRNLDSIGVPLLVFSSGDEPDRGRQANDSDAHIDKRDSIYRVPLLEHIDARDTDQDAAHVRRNFLAGQRAGDGADLLGWCQSQLGAILNDEFEPMARQLSALPRVDQRQPIVIEGDLEIAGNLHVSKLLYARNLVDQTGRRPQVDFVSLNETQSLLGGISQAHAQIELAERRVNAILIDDGHVHDVHLPLRFQRVSFECHHSLVDRTSQVLAMGCPQVAELKSYSVNGRNVSDIQRQALVTGRSMVVGQEVRFEHLVLRGRTSLLASLNKLRMDEIVFGRGRKPVGPVTGHKNFQGGLYSAANVLVDSWNGARVDRQTVLTGSGEQRIEAELSFSEVVLGSSGHTPADYTTSSRIEHLNGLHLDTHLNQIGQLDEDNKFELPVSFDELVISGPAYFSPQSGLAGVNLESLWAGTLFGHSNQNISAPMEFRNVLVSYGGDIQVEGLINGLVLAPDNVMMRDRPYELDNPFVFESDLSVRMLYAEKALNGIQVYPNADTNQLELAILYDGGRQIVTGDKILNEVRLGGRNNIGGLINGHLNLTQLHQLARNTGGQPHRFRNIRLARKLVRVANNVQLHIESLVNGVHVNDICRLATSVATQQVQMRQYDRLKFDQQPVRFKQLHCASINGYNDLRNHFLTRHANQRVAGTLRLVNGATFNSTINIGSTFNELSIEPLARSIAQVLNESRTGHKDFHQDLYIDSLHALRLNDLELARVFVAKSDLPQIVSAPMSFDHLDIENVLVVGHELQTHSFNGLNVSEIMTNTLQYDAPQVIYNHVELDSMQILPGSNLFTKSLNGHDLSFLYSDAVLLDAPQQILAPKTFRGLTEMTNRIALNYGIDGLSERELKFNLLVQSDELIEDDVEFANDVAIMKSLEIQTGQINDQDVNRFVESMVTEGGGGGANGGAGLRVVGNSSIRFHDVRLKNLVLTGLIQNHKLPQDAVQKSDQLNGSYEASIREAQVRQNSQQFLNKLHESGAPFRIQTIFRNQSLAGFCQIHSCPPTTPIIALPPSPWSLGQTRAPAPVSRPPLSRYQPQPQPRPLQQPLPRPLPRPLPQPLQPPPPPQALVHQYRPPAPPAFFKPLEPLLMRPKLVGLVNTSLIPQVWTPVWRPEALTRGAGHHAPANDTHLARPDHQLALADPKYLEYQAYLKAAAIQELARRVNRFLPISYYYEIAQQSPEMGLALHAAPSPIAGEQGYALLFYKEASRVGESCAVRRQGVGVSSLRLRKGGSMFGQNSIIQEASRPSLVESLIVDEHYHYLFVLDITSRPQEKAAASMSQILVYLWNHQSGMYDLREQKPVDGFPLAMRTFAIETRLGCIALANPGIVQANASGAPVLYCQETFQGPFSKRTVLAGMLNIMDLDIVSLPSTGFGAGRDAGQILIAALAQRGVYQIGDLLVGRLDVRRNILTNLLTRRTARPLKVHLVKRSARSRSSTYDLVVSEGITSNKDAQATTRVISLAADGSVLGSQTIRDNQFVDVQSVLLDDHQSMIFMQSAHSISIYAPFKPAAGALADPSCPSDTYQLVQKLPTRGANRFLVFNSLTVVKGQSSSRDNSTRSPFDHFLVLSTNDCEHQRYSTLVLKPHFR